MKDKKVGEYTFKELNEALMEMGFIDIAAEKAAKRILEIETNDDLKELRENLSFITKFRTFVYKIISMAFTAFFWLSGSIIVYYLMEVRKTRGE